MYWTPQSISYYFNGKLVAVAATPPDMNTPMFMIANLGVSSNVSSTTVFPGTMEISSIQAFAYNPDLMLAAARVDSKTHSRGPATTLPGAAP